MISIIIPTYNEAALIAGLIHYLRENAGEYVKEILVIDGGSTDNTVELAQRAGARTARSIVKGRAAQMNLGARQAYGSTLYFVHADCRPPRSFASDILACVNSGYDLGRYRTAFDSKSLLLRLNAFFTRFDIFMCYGGDQTLFIRRECFDLLGGFNEGMRIMEDYDIVQRARQQGAKYAILKKSVLVSARKYHSNSWLAVQKANYTIVQMYKRGASQQDMIEKYKALLHF